MIFIVIVFVCIGAYFFIRKDDSEESQIIEYTPQEGVEIDKNQVAYQEGVTVEELKEDVGATGDDSIYDIMSEYDGRKILTIKPEVQFNVVLAGIIENQMPAGRPEKLRQYDEEFRDKTGVWIDSNSREAFLNLLRNTTQTTYAIDNDGYLVCDSRSGNEIDKKIQNVLNSDNLYIISQKYNNMYNYVYNDVTGNYEEQEVEIELPTYKDTISGDDYKTIECTDIYYIKGSEDSSYTLVTAVNINKNEEANVETFLGLGNEIYCSENNIYVTKAKYDSQYSRVFGTYDYNSETDIFKFKLLDNNIEFLGKGTVNGTVLNQFSMDEYNGYFRIATTGYNEKNDTVNNVFILDENLKEVGSLKGLAEGEKIYSVRFMNDIGYVVTFEQVDPLFVIDLKDPVNPEVKGELKIPGYSSYLHPYDDTHIIGIGMNTEVTKYGSVTTKGIKISMFDVSDLNNPKELFNTILGENYGYSEALNNHKAVLCSKEKELLALPANISDESYDDTFNGAIIFKVDLENNKFVEEIKVKSEKIKSENSSYKYNDEIRRIIYIGDYLYTLADTNVNIIDIDTYKVIDKIEL